MQDRGSWVLSPGPDGPGRLPRQGWPYRTGADRAVAFAVVLGGSSWCPNYPETLRSHPRGSGVPFKGLPRPEREHQTFGEEKSA